MLTNKSNLTVYDHLSNLFIDKWMTTINYSDYFHNCNPSMCTYTTSSKIDYSYTVNLFISLYGGLILILRLISFFIIKLISKSRSFKLYPQNAIQWVKQLNLFKSVHKRSENEIKQQKRMTRIYLISFLSVIITLLLFNSLSTEIIMRNIPNPSLNTYNHLQTLYSHTLRCPCSNMTVPYHQFMSFSPVLHPICSSDFVTDRWLSILRESATQYSYLDWRNSAYQEFSLLSKLCHLSNETITNAVNKFLLQSFIVSNLLSESDFNVNVEKSLVDLYQSTVAYFQHLIDAVNLHIQVDQPFMIRFVRSVLLFDSFSMENIFRNTTDNEQIVEV